QRRLVSAWWLGLPRGERFLLNKLLTGEFRVGVAQTLVIRSLAEAASVDPTVVAARLMGDWTPTADWFTSVVSPGGAASPSQPYPALQQRIGRQRQLAQIMRAVPVVFTAFDVLERDRDIRGEPLAMRRQALQVLLAGMSGAGALRISEEVTAPSWSDLATLRA